MVLAHNDFMPPKKKKTTVKKKPLKHAKHAKAALISKEMTFAEVINKFPQAAPVMMDFGLHCIGCHVSAFETIEQGAMAHGLDEKQLGEMLEKMNKSATGK